MVNTKPLFTALLGLLVLLPGTGSGYSRNNDYLMPVFGFRPGPETNARGTPPAQPALPQWPYAPMQQQPRATQATAQRPAFAPYLETRLNRDTAYVQQSLLLTVDIISAGNLAKIDTSPPQNDAVFFRSLGDPTAESRTRNGQREIVNRLRYLVMPMQAGSIELPPLKVSGSYPDGTKFSATSNTPIQLTVELPNNSVRPWLAVEDMNVRVRLSGDDTVQQGQPLTLLIVQTANGATGSQLHSPESQLRKGAFRLYLEHSEQSSHVSIDGRLTGTRTDKFTVVPQHEGRLKLPSVRIEWWNVNKHRKETALIPGRILLSKNSWFGDLSNETKNGETSPFSSWVFWMPLLLISFATGLYWTLLWARGKSYSQKLKIHVMVATAPLRKQMRALLARLSPRRYLHLARRMFANSLPLSVRLWFCVRVADNEQDTWDWSQVLRFLVQRRLGLPAQVPMATMAEYIVQYHPGADANNVRSLLAELDQALFGHHTIADFNAWKKAFKREIRPHPFYWLGTLLRRKRDSQLETLNPGT